MTATEQQEVVPSTHRVEVVRVHLEPHPNADSLSIVRVWGYQVVVRTADWKDGDLGAYVVPDSVVPDAPAFAFLGEHRRIRVRRFRGVMSQGLLVRAPEGAKEGDDVAEALGVTRYEPPFAKRWAGGGHFGPNDQESPPPGIFPVYSVESWHRYSHAVFSPGDPVIVTEKIHGANGRWMWDGARYWCGSHRTWKKEDPGNLWWKALDECAWLRGWLVANPGVCVYGEVFGPVQSLQYGRAEPDIRVFDLLVAGKFLTWNEAQQIGDGLMWAPTLYDGPYDAATVRACADGPSRVEGADHMREGCVVRLCDKSEVTVSHSAPGGREFVQSYLAVLKIVSDEFLASRFA